MGAVLDQEVKRILSHKGDLWCLIIFFFFLSSCSELSSCVQGRAGKLPTVRLVHQLPTTCPLLTASNTPQTVQSSLLELLSVTVHLPG